jgi:hypothetical protein
MKTITSFSLSANNFNNQQMYMPEGAEVLTAMFEKDKGLFLYVNAQKPSLNHSLRTFKIYNTSDTIYDENLRYISTCFTNDGIIHIFEVI